MTRRNRRRGTRRPAHRDPRRTRELLVAGGAVAAILLATVLVVWILSPDPEGSPRVTPLPSVSTGGGESPTPGGSAPPGTGEVVPPGTTPPTTGAVATAPTTAPAPPGGTSATTSGTAPPG